MKKLYDITIVRCSLTKAIKGEPARTNKPLLPFLTVFGLLFKNTLVP
jgi:hypothetical protein